MHHSHFATNLGGFDSHRHFVLLSRRPGIGLPTMCPTYGEHNLLQSLSNSSYSFICWICGLGAGEQEVNKLAQTNDSNRTMITNKILNILICLFIVLSYHLYKSLFILFATIFDIRAFVFCKILCAFCFFYERINFGCTQVFEFWCISVGEFFLILCSS